MEQAEYTRGDWVTLTEPGFLAGARAVVVQVRKKLMRVAYLSLSGEVSTRDVPIGSVYAGHRSRGRGPEAALQRLVHSQKLDDATELAGFAVREGFLEQSRADELVRAYTAHVVGDRAESVRASAEADQRVLAEWLRAQPS